MLVQELQKARADYSLPAALERLDRYPLLLIDDIGYVRRDEQESSVLFELICHRYERRSVLITANQPFTAWDEIFPSSSPGSPGELPPEAPTDPYVTLSCHTAPVIQPQPAPHANGQTSQVAVGKSAPEAHDYGDAYAVIVGASAAARRPAPDSGS